MIFASATAFGFVHIIFYSPFSMITTFILGIYLAYIYEKTNSVLFTTILHGYLGDVVFTVGWATISGRIWENTCD